MPLGANKAAIMGVAGVSTADAVLLHTSTITSATTAVSITSGLTSTYNTYVFTGYNVHGSASSDAQFQVSTDGGSNYNTTVTMALHYMANSAAGSAEGPAQSGASINSGTGFAGIASSFDNAAADNNVTFEVHLYNPASTTYMKTFHTIGNCGGASTNYYPSAGYFNTTSAVNAIQFSMTSGNIDSCIIKMWGIK